MTLARLDSRVDDAFNQLATTQAATASNTARLDNINGQIKRLGDEQATTNEKLTAQGDEMRDRFADVREDLKGVAVRTSIVCGALVTVICSTVGGLGILLVQNAVKTELHSRPVKTTPTASTPAPAPAANASVVAVNLPPRR